MIRNFSEFCTELVKSGFSMGGGNSKGVFALIPFDWKNQDELVTLIKWHTGDPETDPWEWRMRVLEERNDIAYAKLFFNASGYITKEWYPYFLSVRRNGKTLEQEYQNGKISNYEKRIYDIITENEVVPLDLIKRIGGFSKEDKSKFDRAITQLQMKMYITMCGRAQKKNKHGEEYGWNSTVFCTAETFWGNEFVEKAFEISSEVAERKIREQILLLNPNADEKKIKKFIYG